MNYHSKNLVKTVGYWSDRTIYCNLTSNPIELNHNYTDEELLTEISSLQRIITNKFLNKYFDLWTKRNYLGPLDVSNILHEFNCNWRDLPTNISRIMTCHADKSPQIIADLWWENNNTAPQSAVDFTALKKIPLNLSPLIINWQSLIANNPHFIQSIWDLSAISAKLDYQAHPNWSKLRLTEKSESYIAAMKTEQRLLVEWAIPFLSQLNNPNTYYHGVKLAIHAASAAISWLRTKKYIVLPPHSQQTYEWLKLFEPWPRSILASKIVKPAIKSGLLDFIATSSTSHIDDIPINILSIYRSDYFKLNFYSDLSALLKHPQIEKKRNVFPIDYLQVSTLKKVNKVDSWTPEWVKKRFGTEWGEFATLWWLHNASNQHKRNSLKTYLTWACKEQHFESPWSIKVEDIRNPHRPKIKNTYYHFLKKKKHQNKSASWSTAATLCRIVCQYALLPNSPVLVQHQIINAFKSLDNPFSNRRKNLGKTPRTSLPTTLHEVMIDIILSPDEQGVPTFKWAKEVSQKYKIDIVKIPNPQNPKTEIEVWCPSRATSLSTLLLTPVRGVQARWLDQGLMDQESYSFEKKEMVPNPHHLKNFRYTNGKSHEQQYGRPSGVLQLSSDLLTREKSLSLFINTNKTQIWNGAKLSGYELPWPDGSDLLNSEEPEQRAKGEWLARVYRVLDYQFNWMTTYDPDPHPLSFAHSWEDRGRVADLEDAQLNLPWFIPLFRDLSLNKYITDTIHGQPFRASCPISKSKIVHLYDKLAVETEKRIQRDHGRSIYITKKNKNNQNPKCVYDLHSLRVTWISRLFEMGLPVHIISQYIAGHASKLMTLHYLQCQPAHIREQLIQILQNNDIATSLETLLKKLDSDDNLQTHLVRPGRFNDFSDDFPQDFAAVVPVAGGICPMGGRGSSCNIGALHDLESSDLDNESADSPVQGGCGNCRFFATGPDFLIDQLLTLNTIMLEMRSIGKAEQQLYRDVDIIKRKSHNLSMADTPKKQRLQFEANTLLERIHDYDRKLLPMCYEWFNRHEMLLDSYHLLGKKIEDNQLTLISGTQLSINDLSIEATDTTDVGLARGIVEQARILKRNGYPLSDSGADIILREFMSIILSEQTGESFLLKIPDKNYSTEAASLIAGWLFDEFGDEKLQESIDKRAPLPFTITQNNKLNLLIENLHSNYIAGNPQRGLVSCFPEDEN
ncbi:MAG: hypothetical protein ACI8ZB_003803 [Desulforhopalus sp.]|jgi:hypothetical protein